MDCRQCGGTTEPHVALGYRACCYWRRPQVQEANKLMAREAYARKALYRKTARWGLDAAGTDRMLSAQGEKCAICSRTLLDSAKTAEVDIGADGLVRGILCKCCISGLEAFGKKRDVLLSALLYLKEHGARMTP